MVFYHSGCGNSRFVAEILAERLEENIVFIPDANLKRQWLYSIGPNESVGFVWPVYAWAPPALVTTFVEKLSLSRKPKYVWLVCTCGDEAGYTEKFFRKSLRERGLELNAAWTLQMPETYINLKSMRLDTPENAAAKIAKVKEKLPSIAEAIIGKRSVVEMVEGSHPFVKSYLVRALFNLFLVTDKKFHTTDACTGCGVCAKACPQKNITVEQGRPVWHGNCSTCNACYHTCPHNAIHFGKASYGKGQYLFPKDKQ